MKRMRAVPVVLAALLLLLCAAPPGGAAELGRPTVYADAWGGMFLGLPSDSAQPEERGWAAGMAAGAYCDLGRRAGGAIRISYWEVWDDDLTFSRRYTGVDALLGPRRGEIRLLAGVSILDRRDFAGEQWGGWGWRLGATGEKVFRRLVAGGGLYATPHLLLRRWLGGLELDPAEASALEEEFYLVVPLGGAWAVRGGYRGFQLGVREAGGWRWEDGEGFFLGTTARF